MNHVRLFPRLLVLLIMAAAVLQLPAYAEDDGPSRLADKYPDLSRGVLGQALLAPMEADVLVRVRDREITRDMLADRVEEIPDELRPQAEDYMFYVLEGMVTEPILLAHILGEADPDGMVDPANMQQVLGDYIGNVVDSIEIDVQEARTFYDENQEVFSETDFEDVKEEVINYLRSERQRDAWEEHTRNIGRLIPIKVNADWITEHAARSKDNPVDNARAGDKPVLVVFTADWCPACQQLKPVLDRVVASYEDTIVVKIIDTDKRVFLSTRYGVSSIPVLVFFNADGEEVFRHTGFMEEEDLIARLELLGAS